MGKKVRRVPVIQADNRYIDRQEFMLCSGENCRNAIAVSRSQQKRGDGPIFCSLCRKKQT